MSLKISGHTKLLGFFADPAAHSKSPAMYNTAFEKLGIDYVYLAFRVDQSTLSNAIQAMRTLDMRGGNISMPNKTAVLPLLDKLSREAKLCGAVNTIVNNNGILTGYNTDGAGAMKALASKGFSIAEKKLVLLGAGGAGTAIIAQAALDGAKEINVFVREHSIPKHRDFIQKIAEETDCPVTLLNMEDHTLLASRLRKSDILINATSVGMEPHSDICPIPDPSFLHSDLFVMDIIYSPSQTLLLKYAEKRGCQNMNGLGMLLYQGAVAFELYTGKSLPVEDVKRVWGI